MSGFFKQDMPPPGGYPPIHIERMKSKRFLSNFNLFLFGVAASIYTIHLKRNKSNLRTLGNIEVSNALIALEPFIEAERDRMYLKNLIRLRDEEAETMKRFPDWVPGTLFGLPRYKTLPNEVNPTAEISEYWMFRPMYNKLDYVYPDRHLV
ncbi:NADH dehydrogenase [ubiquinone] 1 alpha subcomplex subunit 13 [Tetranychus urticae]|uniref:NADH dehydrogenase [ubiquinone] 1 alpha subcomplex subunit 13 n=1 Tax=Tetranychus urticae TaxID=32264 RepID=T1KU87_TETUR|nr:NADH dehydrogenase [ubiquinone] 1 alpha subcomplex subunit 13 [Tetranychus urticae]